jgi:nitroimidazol reductase NimA-like FMN-containing flavoprotein (pyridoxamine 5'-phosphate oxidase superfamily)
MQGELSGAEMDALLSSEVFGHMGCTDGTRPYIVPMAYVYHGNALYGQTTEGKKVEVLRKHSLVCFQVQKQEHRRWRSVICWGTFEELDFRELQKPQAVEVVKLLTQRIGAIQDNVGIAVPFSFSDKAAPMTVNEKTSTLFRISITEKTGRFFEASRPGVM